MEWRVGWRAIEGGLASREEDSPVDNWGWDRRSTVIRIGTGQEGSVGIPINGGTIDKHIYPTYLHSPPPISYLARPSAISTTHTVPTMAHLFAFVSFRGRRRAYCILPLVCALPPGTKLRAGSTFEIKLQTYQNYQTAIAQNPGYNYTISYNRRHIQAPGGRGGCRERLKSVIYSLDLGGTASLPFFYLYLQLRPRPLRSLMIAIKIATAITIATHHITPSLRLRRDRYHTLFLPTPHPLLPSSHSLSLALALVFTLHPHSDFEDPKPHLHPHLHPHPRLASSYSSSPSIWHPESNSTT